MDLASDHGHFPHDGSPSGDSVIEKRAGGTIEVGMDVASQDPVIQEFIREVLAENPLHEKFMISSIKSMNNNTINGLSYYFKYCLSCGIKLDFLASCYNTIVADTRFEQIFFMKTKKYRWSRFKEVADNVYYNPEYMKKYMYGLALTSFLWPNHAEIHEFYVKTFPYGRKGVYLEIGPGHGYYFLEAAKLGAFSRMIGVDLSPTSVTMTRDIIAYSNLCAHLATDIIEADFISFSGVGDDYACIVMGEVLEHVEEPGLFLEKIASISGPETHIFVTTCVNAPAVDHIYLFRSPAEVETLAQNNGLDILERCYVPHAGKSLEDCQRLSLPVNVAYVMKKK